MHALAAACYLKIKDVPSVHSFLFDHVNVELEY